MQDAVAATEAPASWQQLPPELQHKIMVMSHTPCVRRVCKATRSTFDSMNNMLRIRALCNPQHAPIAKAAVMRVAQRSPKLTSIVLPGHGAGYVTLADLTAVTGLAAALKVITELRVDCKEGSAQLQALQQCTGLVHLSLSNSSSWDNSRALVNLAIAAALQSMSRLTHLEVTCYGATHQGATALASSLQSLTQLVHLKASGSVNCGPGTGMPAVSLSAMRGLRILDINGSLLWREHPAEALAAALQQAPSLTSLNACSCSEGPHGAMLLAPVLQRLSGLQHLGLDRAGLGDEGVAALAPALAALPGLQTLNLANNGLGQGAMVALQPVLAREGSPLRSLALSRNELTRDAVLALAAALPSASRLQALYLDQTGISLEDAALLAPALTMLAPTLLTVLVYDKHYERGQLGTVGVGVALSQALQALTGLTHLELGRRIGSEGVQTIAPALGGMRGLSRLVLLDNRMGPSGAAALAQVLPSFAGSLQRLDLNGCNIGSEGAAALAPTLAQCTRLTQLRLGHSSFAPVAVNALLPALRALHLLKELWLFCEELGEGGYLSIAHAMAGKDTLPTLRVKVLVRQSATFVHRAGWKQLHALQDVSAKEITYSDEWL